MDNILITLIDVLFFAIGGVFLRALRLIGIKVPLLGHWTQVVLGFFVSVIFLIVVVFLIGEFNE